VRGAACASTIALLALLLSACAGAPAGQSAAGDYYNIGNAYVALGQDQKAIESYQNALRLDPGLVKADFNLALAYVRVKRDTDAEAIVTRLLKADPQNTQLLAALAWIYHAEGRDIDSLAQYDAIIALSPADADALYNSAIVLWKLDRKSEALQRLRAELALSPDDPDAMFAAGSILLALDDPAGSYDMFSSYLSKKPDDREALYLVAAGAERMQKYGRALDAYDKIVAGDASQADAWFGEARLLLTVVQDPERGLTALSRALSAGFKDEAAVKVLLDTQGLLERDKVEAAVKEHGLLPETAGAPTQSGESAQQSGADQGK
jgi:tetratricopeptide (TPR) repeat protein